MSAAFALYDAAPLAEALVWPGPGQTAMRWPWSGVLEREPPRWEADFEQLVPQFRQLDDGDRRILLELARLFRTQANRARRRGRTQED